MDPESLRVLGVGGGGGEPSGVGFKVDLMVHPARKPRAGSLLLEFQYPGGDCVSEFPLMVSPFPLVLLCIFKNNSVLLKVNCN